MQVFLEFRVPVLSVPCADRVRAQLETILCNLLFTAELLSACPSRLSLAPKLPISEPVLNAHNAP